MGGACFAGSVRSLPSRLNSLYPLGYDDLAPCATALVRLDSAFLSAWEAAFKPHVQQQMLLAFTFELDLEAIEVPEEDTLLHAYCFDRAQIKNHTLQTQAMSFDKQLQRLAWAFSNLHRFTAEQQAHLAQGLKLLESRLPERYLRR